MSRIGRLPISLPQGVEVKKTDDNTVTVKGIKGTLTQKLHIDMLIDIKEDVVNVKRPSDTKMHKSLHGLTRTLIDNMVIGVTDGFSRVLEINGVGYKAQKKDNKLILTLGYSHLIEMIEPEGIVYELEGQNKITVRGIDKQLVGECAARIRIKRKPEVYKGKGIKYIEEHIRRKEGKAGA